MSFKKLWEKIPHSIRHQLTWVGIWLGRIGLIIAICAMGRVLPSLVVMYVLFYWLSRDDEARKKKGKLTNS